MTPFRPYLLPLLSLTAVMFASCAGQQPGYRINAAGGSPIYASEDAIATWNIAEGFLQATPRLRMAASHYPALCELAPGNDLVVYAAQGYVLPLTANLAQYWAAVIALPPGIEAGSVTRLTWADSRSGNALCSGEAGVRVLQSFDRQANPRPGSAAGSVTVLARDKNRLRLRLNLLIPVQERGPGGRPRIVRGLLEREVEVICRPLASKIILDAFPKGANEEVEVPRLGAYKHR